MNYLTVKEVANKWNVTERCIQNYCIGDKIPGAKCIGKQWLIPDDAEKPVDGRRKNAKEQIAITQYHFPIFIYSPCYATQNILNDDEKMLLKAQLLHLEGKYSDSIMICRELLNRSPLPYLQAGIYFTIGFDALMLGIHSEFKNSVEALKTITDADVNHREDFNLIRVFLIYHGELNSEQVTEIDPLKLSSEAFVFYKYLMLLYNILSQNKADSVMSKYLFSGVLAMESLKIDPILCSFYCLLGVQNVFSINQEEKHKLLTLGVKIAIENSWISHLAKFYFYGAQPLTSVVSKYGKDCADKLIERAQTNFRNIRIIYCLEKDERYSMFDFSQLELLLLVSYNFSYEKISKIIGITINDVKKEIGKIQIIANVKTRYELVRYARKQYYQMTDNDPINPIVN